MRQPAKHAYRRPPRGSSRARIAATLATMITVVAGFSLATQLAGAPGYSNEFTGVLTSASRTTMHAVSLEKGEFTASLSFEGTPPASAMTAQLTLQNAAGKVVATDWGTSPVRVTASVPAGDYRVLVSSRWPLKQRNLGYRLTIQLTPTGAPTPSPTVGSSGSPSTSPSATAGPSPTQTPTPSTSPTPTTVPTATPSPTASSLPTTSPSPTPTPTPSPTATPSTGSGDLVSANCGTWVLYQVSSETDLDRLRPKIEAALALPGVTGFSVRFPWSAADITGSATSAPILEKAKQIAQGQGKALSIRFMAGSMTPARVFDSGASYYLSSTGAKVPLPWDNATGSNAVFVQAYQQYVAKLAAWSRANGVNLLHLSWYGQDWAELNHGAELRAAPGYSQDAWLSGHKRLIDVAVAQASSTLSVELPLSGYGPLSGGQSEDLAEYIVSKLGNNNPQFFIQANGWDETQEWGSPSTEVETQFDRIWKLPVLRGLQMIQPDGYDWTRVYDRLEASDATYAEVYLPSFWQVPGPSPTYSHNTSERIAQLEAEIAAFDRTVCK